MIKLFALAFTISAFALSTSFANCGGGSCDGGKKKDKKDDKSGKDQVVQTVQF